MPRCYLGVSRTSHFLFTPFKFYKTLKSISRGVHQNRRNLPWPRPSCAPKPPKPVLAQARLCSKTAETCIGPGPLVHQNRPNPDAKKAICQAPVPPRPGRKYPQLAQDFLELLLGLTLGYALSLILRMLLGLISKIVELSNSTHGQGRTHQTMIKTNTQK